MNVFYDGNICIKIGNKIYWVPIEKCEDWLSQNGEIPNGSNEQYERAAEQIVFSTGDKYLKNQLS